MEIIIVLHVVFALSTIARMCSHPNLFQGFIYQDKNLSCGQHKQEMLNQLRELAKSEPSIKQDLDPLARLHNVADENEQDFTVQHLLRASKHDGDHGTRRGHEV